MINREKLLIIFVIIIALGSCGRKGDLLPPPKLTSKTTTNTNTNTKKTTKIKKKNQKKK